MIQYTQMDVIFFPASLTLVGKKVFFIYPTWQDWHFYFDVISTAFQLFPHFIFPPNIWFFRFPYKVKRVCLYLSDKMADRRISSIHADKFFWVASSFSTSRFSNWYFSNIFLYIRFLSFLSSLFYFFFYNIFFTISSTVSWGYLFIHLFSQYFHPPFENLFSHYLSP